MCHDRKKLFAMTSLVAMAFVTTSAHAQLQYLGPVDIGGAGLGHVSTILTIQNAPAESGTVGLDAFGNLIIEGDAKTGASQTLLRSLSELGVGSATALHIVFNANEPAGNSVILSDLQLNIYSPTGTLLFNSGAFSPISFDETLTGTGNAGFLFGLDSTQAVLAQSAAFSGNFGNNLVGLSATVDMAAGGPETFFGVAAVPEPSTYGMLGLGLLGLTWLRRRSQGND